MRDIRHSIGDNKKKKDVRFNPQGPVPEDLPEDVKELYEKYAHPEKSSPAKNNKPLPTTDIGPKPTVSKPGGKPKFLGSKVSIAQIHAPEPSESTKDRRVKKRFQEKMQQVGGSPGHEKDSPTLAKKPGARPLFVNPEKPEPSPKMVAASAPSKSPVRLGQKERGLVLGLILVVLLAGGLAAVVFLPSAMVRLTLATAPLLVDYNFSVVGNGAALDPDAVPGEVIEREVGVTGTVPVTSSKVVGKKATGTVRIINRTTQEQSIKEQSRLVTEDGRLYFMQKHAIVPPGEGAVLGAATVSVVADLAGDEANLASGRLNFAGLDSSAQSVLYAEVATPIGGGSGEAVLVVQETDLDQARKAAITQAQQQAAPEAASSLPPDFIILEESWQGDVLNFSSEAALEEEREVIPYTATIKLRVLGYDETAMRAQLEQALAAELTDGFMLFPGELSFTKSVREVNWDDEVAKLTARVTHTTIPELSIDTLREKLAGRTSDEAKTYLEALPGVESANVELSPFWVKSLPRIEKRVNIDLISDREP